MKKVISTAILLLIIIATSACNRQNNEELIKSSTSPNGTRTVEAYLVNAGATVDHSVKVYLLQDNDKKLIYNEYHCSEAEIDWQDENTVIINEVKLDLSKEETYDWRQD